MTHTRTKNGAPIPTVIYQIQEEDNPLQERVKKDTNIIRTKTTSNSNETGQVTIKYGRKPGKLNPPPGPSPNTRSRSNGPTTESPENTKPKEIELITLEDDGPTKEKVDKDHNVETVETEPTTPESTQTTGP